MIFGPAAGWREGLRGEPVLSAFLVGALLLAYLLDLEREAALRQALALRAENWWSVATYWLMHDGWGHLWANLFLLALLSALLELESRKRLALGWGLGMLGSGLLYWLGLQGAPGLFPPAPPAVGASMGAYALILPAFYFLLRVFHVGALLETMPERFTSGELNIGGVGPLYGMALALAGLVGLLVLARPLGGPEPGSAAGHLLGYGVGVGLAFGYWHWDFIAVKGTRAGGPEEAG